MKEEGSRTGMVTPPPMALWGLERPEHLAFDQFAAKYRNDPSWRFHELRTGHDAMLLVPDEVLRVLTAGL